MSEQLGISGTKQIIKETIIKEVNGFHGIIYVVQSTDGAGTNINYTYGLHYNYKAMSSSEILQYISIHWSGSYWYWTAKKANSVKNAVTGKIYSTSDWIVSHANNGSDDPSQAMLVPVNGNF